MHTIFCVNFELISEYNFQRIPQFDGSYNPLKIALFRIEGKGKIEELNNISQTFIRNVEDCYPFSALLFVIHILIHGTNCSLELEGEDALL